MAEAATQHEFQAEVSQLLDLMIHSLYSNKEIFLRELISNASDACDKLRFLALQDQSLFGGDTELAIHITYDKAERTITVSDNGIGMNRDDVIANIGTIAKSGTKEFLKTLTGDAAKDTQLIGQFGVGFYSAFVVADRVTIITRKAGEQNAVRWESDGRGSYTLETSNRVQRGTDIILHLREDAAEFLDGWRLRGIIRKYSDHILLPIKMLQEESFAGAEADDKAETETTNKAPEWEQINDTTAIWTKSKKDISAKEYEDFYQSIAHDFQPPLTWTHNRVEGKQEYISLLYIPQQAQFDLWDQNQRHGIKLYIKRVFVMEDNEKLMPRYLRFIRGIIDSSDLPLNVSREILQSNKLIDNIRSGSVKKILSLLEDMAKDKPEDYAKFWSAFGNVLKEGIGEDFSNREQIAKLLRFSSTHMDSAVKNIALDDYINRMPAEQDKIYYLTADSYMAASNSPHLEIFRKNNIEVLLLHDRVDEWMMQYLREYSGKKFASVAKGDLDLGALDKRADKEKAKDETESKTNKELLEKVRKALGDQVKDVKISNRLTSSPSCIVINENEMALHVQRLMQQAGHEIPASKPILEINPEHALIVKMAAEQDQERFNEWAQLLYEQAVVAEGGQLADPAAFVKRLNRLLIVDRVAE